MKRWAKFWKVHAILWAGGALIHIFDKLRAGSVLEMSMTLVNTTGSAYAAKRTWITPQLHYFEALFGGKPAGEGSSKLLEFRPEFSIVCSATVNIIGKSIVRKHMHTQLCSQRSGNYE